MNRVRMFLFMPAWELPSGTGPAKQTLLQLLRRDGLQTPRPVPPVRHFRLSTVFWSSEITRPGKGDKDRDEKEAGKSLMTTDRLFERGPKTKAVFERAVDVFCQRDIRRRGHVEFIYVALKKMKEFGVERDVAVYNKILDIFPKEVFVPQNFIQRMYNHYPRQQECGVQVLEQMETYGVMPNKETRLLLLQIFGNKSHPVRKYQRIMYWFPKFKHINPHPVPDPLPQDPVDLARLSLQRIAADLDARITAYQLPYEEVLDSGKVIDHPHIIGIQSLEQQSLLARHRPERPVFVEGPFRLWLKNACVYYYVLRAELVPLEERQEGTIDPERNFYYPMQLDFDLERGPWDDEEFDIDEVEEGPVFAMCMAGAGDQATLAKWIVGLQETNPMLSRTPVVFRLTPGPRELQARPDAEENGDEEMARSQSGSRES